MELGWPLVGRQPELAAIHSALAVSGTAGTPGTEGTPGTAGIVLAGPPGVGRTRLLRAATEHARRIGYRVETVAATRAAATIALGAMSHLLPAGPAESGRQPPGLWYLRQILDRLVNSPGDDRPVLLAVDDAQLLDDASATAVHHIVMRRAARVVATVRNGEGAPDAIVALWKDELAQRLDVPLLPDEAIDELVSRALDGDVSGVARARLRALAAGNPLYLRELMVGGVRGGALRQEAGMWCVRGRLRGDERLEELIETRLRACGDEGRAVVELVALGEPVPLAMLEGVPGLADAERAGLLMVVADGRRWMARLAHPVYGEVVRAGIGPIRTRAVYRELIARLGTTPLRRRDDLLLRASWQLGAGGVPQPDVLLPAARQAAARFDFGLAERLARAGGTGDPAAARLLAEILRWQGRAGESLAVLADDPRQVIRAGCLYWGLARRLEADQALSRADDEPGTEAARAMMLLFDGRCRDALDAARTAFERSGCPVEARLWACTAAVLAAGHLGYTDFALDLAAQGLGLTDRPRDEALVGRPHLRLAHGSALLLGGRLPAARAAAEHGYAGAAGIGNSGLVAAWAGLLGMVAQAQGDLAGAATALREAVALDEQQDPTGLYGYHLAVFGGVLAQLGNLDGARAVLERQEAVGSEVHRVYAAQIALNRARIAAALSPVGPSARAARLATAAADLAARNEQRCVEAYALYEAACLGVAGQVRARLTELAGILDSELVRAFAATADGLADADPVALDDATGRLEDLGAALAAAHAATAASRAYRRTGHHRAARAAHQRAQALERRCRGTAGVSRPDPLTAREREIATRAAAGCSASQIARQLHLSIRTVNNHLHRSYAKLGISGRGELVAVLASGTHVAVNQIPPVDRSTGVATPADRRPRRA